MSNDATDWAGYVDAMAALQRLPLNDARRAAVIEQLINIESLARRFVDFPLPVDVEPAPVFRP